MNKKNFKIILILFLIMFLGIIYFFVFSKDNYNNQDDKKKDIQKQEEMEKESDDILKKINKIFVAPDEDPIVSRITDINKPELEQAFFDGVENGDYLLIYKNAGKAVLYSDSKGKILNMGPFSTKE